MVRYSLLTSDSNIITNTGAIGALLKQGIKVLVFGAPSSIDPLIKGNERYQKARLLQTYPIQEDIPAITIKDGQFTTDTKTSLERISALAPSFNYEQYLIEHADAYNSLFVEAGAGTGKTTVMIEKIIRFIKDGGDVGEILAVTFTKKAASQMKEKLRKALIYS